jgi:rod shape-determining protein MreC
VALCVVGVVLGKIQTTARNDGRIDPVGTAVGAAVGPVAKVLAIGVNGTSDFFSGLFAARTLKVENRSLRDLQTAASMYTEQVERLEREIDELRRLQNLPPMPGKEKVPADVIYYFPYENRVTVSVGSNQGIHRGQAVVTADGLLGVVQTVDATRSQVLLLAGMNSATLRIGAVARRNPPPAGLLKGEGGTLLTLEFEDPKAPVDNGDEIFTAGFSDRIPPGIKIGRVIQVTDDPNSGTRRATVYPSVSMGNVHEVVVLK